ALGIVHIEVCGPELDSKAVCEGIGGLGAAGSIEYRGVDFAVMRKAAAVAVGRPDDRELVVEYIHLGVDIGMGLSGRRETEDPGAVTRIESDGVRELCLP